MPKGKKRLKGVPILHDEVKQTHGIKLTDTAWDEIGKAAIELGISRSELIERYGRNIQRFLAFQRLQELEDHYHIRIQTPFQEGEHYFVGATRLGETGWNGKPDYESSGMTLAEAVNSLMEKLRVSE